MKIELVDVTATEQVNSLIKDGWDFMLHFGNHTFAHLIGSTWEADFTRLKPDGKWDNHKCGYGKTPEEAINNAYENIKNGNRLKSTK